MPGDQKTCPDTESLILLIQNELDAAAAQRLLSHIGECRMCKDEHQELLELESIAHCLRDNRTNQRDEQRIQRWQQEMKHALRERSSGILAVRPNVRNNHN